VAGYECHGERGVLVHSSTFRGSRNALELPDVVGDQRDAQANGMRRAPVIPSMTEPTSAAAPRCSRVSATVFARDGDAPITAILLSIRVSRRPQICIPLGDRLLRPSFTPYTEFNHENPANLSDYLDIMGRRWGSEPRTRAWVRSRVTGATRRR
jgi:hypothetical protein